MSRSFEAQQRTFSAAAGDAEALTRYFGSGSGDGSTSQTSQTSGDKKCEKQRTRFIEQVLIERDGQKGEEAWRTWGIRLARIDKVHKYATGAGIVIAVVDSGVDLDHPSLVGHLLPGFDFVENDALPDDTPNGQDDDGDGAIDEGLGHGTHIAGVIARVAPQATILPVRVLNSDGRGTLFDVVNGLVFAVDHGAKVINLSMRVIDNSAALAAAIDFAVKRQVVVVAATAFDDGRLDYPAAYDGVVSVGSIDFCEEVVDLTETEADQVDVFAPGELIYSSYIDGQYAWWSGTSMATAFVSGEASLLLERGICAPTGVVDVIQTVVKHLKSKLALKKGYIQVEQAVRSKFRAGMCAQNLCDPNASQTLEFRDREIRWQVTNAGGIGLEIARIEITWPAANGFLDEVKKEGDIIHKGDFRATSVVIASGWEGNPDKRTIKPGETKSLKFKFAENVAPTWNEHHSGVHQWLRNHDRGALVFFRELLPICPCARPASRREAILDPSARAGHSPRYSPKTSF